MKAAERGLKALFRVMDGDASFQKAELALTLHMLEFLAPRFFVEQRLAGPRDVALKALATLSTAFGRGLDAEEAMARLDGLYLCAVRGLPPRKFDPEALKACVAQQEERLWRWLMGELAARLGVDARFPIESSGLYHLTHVVLVDSEYLMKPVSQPLEELERALDRLAREEAWDLLAECIFCLNRAGTPTKSAVEALRGAQKKDGTFAESGSSPRVVAHCTAAGILALAGALDLERSAP